MVNDQILSLAALEDVHIRAEGEPQGVIMGNLPVEDRDDGILKSLYEVLVGKSVYRGRWQTRECRDNVGGVKPLQRCVVGL